MAEVAKAVVLMGVVATEVVPMAEAADTAAHLPEQPGGTTAGAATAGAEALVAVRLADARVESSVELAVVAVMVWEGSVAVAKAAALLVVDAAVAQWAEGCLVVASCSMSHNLHSRFHAGRQPMPLDLDHHHNIHRKPNPACRRIRCYKSIQVALVEQG